MKWTQAIDMTAQEAYDIATKKIDAVIKEIDAKIFEAAVDGKLKIDGQLIPSRLDLQLKLNYTLLFSEEIGREIMEKDRLIDAYYRNKGYHIDISDFLRINWSTQ